jgi:uncharacterized protein (TIGR01777 family)
MNVLVTGASGLVGSALVPHLTRAGHRVIELRRGEFRRPQTSEPDVPFWNPDNEQIDLAPAGQLDAVIHLAGENIAQRWNPKTKKRIRDSRVRGTELISRAVAALRPHPRALLCASATGYYGHRGDEVLTEESKAGTGFLADLCQQWEAATATAAQAGLRVVNLRIGIVLDQNGGALRKMLPAFRAGLGGRVGSGCQYWSWVTLGDVVRIIEHLLNGETLRGPFNLVSPGPMRNSDFTKTLARALGRPAILPIPAFALRMLLGEMADEALLASARVIPQRLEQSGFRFADDKLAPALRKVLAKNTVPG